MRSNLLKKFLVLVFASFISLILLELGLRFFLPGSEFDTRLPLYAHVRETRESIELHGLSSTARRTTNKWGFRGDEPPENWDDYYTIVAVGGSTTQSFYVDDGLIWTALLQDNLRETNERVWVGNAGLDGHTSRGHILLMQQVITKIRPDAIVLLVGVNDLGLSFYENRRIEGSSYDLTQRRRRDYWLNQSRIYQVLNRAYKVYVGGALTVGSGHSDFIPEPLDPAMETPLPDDLREVLPQLPEYVANLETIIEIAQSVDTDVLILTQPSLYDDSEEWLQIRGISYFLQDQNLVLSAASWWRLLDQYNQATLEFCEEQNVACYDLAARIPHSLDYFYDAVHFTEAGNALVAEEVARGVREELWQSGDPFP